MSEKVNAFLASLSEKSHTDKDRVLATIASKKSKLLKIRIQRKNLKLRVKKLVQKLTEVETEHEGLEMEITNLEALFIEQELHENVTVEKE